MAIAKVILNGETLMDVTSNTASANNMLSGIVGTKNDGTQATGNIINRNEADITAPINNSELVVTVPWGYYSTSTTYPIALTTHNKPTIGLSSTTGVITASHNLQTECYVPSTVSYTTTSTYQLTTQAAQTLYPSTADQTVASYRWLTGTQTFKSVTTTNLTAENIAEGVVVKVGDSSNASRITQVTGTHSSANTYTATISGSGNSSYCWVSHNNTKYYTNGNTFTFYEGETITVYTRGNSAYTYDYTLPAGNIIIEITYTSSSNNSINILESIIPTNILSITSNGLYNVYSYSQASVDVTNEYYYVYKTIAETQQLNNSISGFTEYLSNISSVGWGTFCNIQFASGAYTFSNLRSVPSGAFNCLTLMTWAEAQMTLSFPMCSVIGAYAFAQRKMLSEVYFPNCSLIGNSAFYSCNSLTTISFPLCSKISNYTFYSCTKLISASFPNCISIGANTFAYCSSLTTINFPICQSIGSSAFMYCTKITEAIFSSCSYMGIDAFFGCYGLTTINFSSCPSIGVSAFYNCSQLSSITFPACQIIGGGAFLNCIALSIASFPSCISIGATAFQNCTALSSISFPLCTYISTSAFASCKSLTQINFPACSIVGIHAFSYCENLTVASFPICTSIGNYTFRSCYNLISLYLNNVSMVPSISTNTFASTPISTYSTVAGRYGSVFVPSSLYASFLADVNWKSYSARLVSV